MLSLRTARTAYISTWALGLIIAALFETNVLPASFMALSNEALYFANLLCIATALGGTFLALRLMVFGRIKTDLEAHPDHLVQWSLVRLAIQATAVFISLFSYYLLAESSTAKYTLLIATAGMLFCWPEASEKKETEEKQ